VQYNVVLEELHLDTNQIDDDGVSQLAGMLAVNKSIRTVNLAANRIGDVGIAALAEMLKCNSTLTELDLSSNEIGYDGIPPALLRTALMHSCTHVVYVPNE
jgi:NLR family CARD domain-containing protein 3